MTAKEIRQAFLNFFASKGHMIVPSAPIVVKNDPTLMFTNAGMNQFKDVFLGEAPAKAPRVADTQRCLRVSGKHNDLEEVGIDTYHHTMFEMLGNWSFGDYFKKEAIAWSWELLTQVYKLDTSRLYVTYFEGDEKEGLEKDTETYNLWKQYVPEDRILPGNKKDNFWEMGETGPCGPCSEIHFDSRPDNERNQVSGASLVNADHDQVIEIWNNVFMQFNRLKDGSLQPLPNKHVDTGMGFERLVRVLQGKTSNYDTDVFQPMIQFIADKSGKKYNSASKPGDADWNDAVAMRVLADHIRAISFAIADGQLPASNRAGYVIRRILRRAVRYSYQTLGFKEPFFNELVPLLAQQFKGVFDELWEQKDFVQKVILEEEVSFLRTLSAGIKKFKEVTAEGDKIISGSIAFELSDTYGFPIDLTELMAREIGASVDIKGYEEALQTQKLRSRAATAVSAGDWVVLRGGDNTEFVGYDELYTECDILKYRKVTAQGKEQYQLVLNRTPFYAEGGGQVGDTGNLTSEWYDEQKGPLTFEVTDTKKENGLIIHYANLQPYYTQDGPAEWILPNPMPTRFTAYVDMGKRIMTNANHSATHLLHAALKETLGEHVNQKGSLVNSEQLRFDFSHFQKVTDDEIETLERIVNQKVREGIPIKDERRVRYAEAIERGVTALFGEKYGDYVRMVTFDDNFSKELCGGTHVKNTAEIGFFKITGESAVAAGVRRIEAITSYHSLNYIQEEGRLVKNLKELLRNPADLSKSVENLIEENNRMKKELEKAVMLRASGLKDQLAKTAENINGVNFIAQRVELPTADAIKNLAYNLKDIVPNLFLVLAANINGKPSITVMIDETLVKDKGLHAGNIVRELAKEVKGGGGGQPFFATAGGSDVNGIDNVLAKAKSFVQ
ncbi:alanine--tRNA ligase [Mucilaginibacter sp. AK015]|uniref:alanine--tRNA ligase n=1 Tax=Mucilaginibacter sp. AK015 TaxID=2723072 RepID=UPI001616D225|nr:alanine--tRNA ligase [Mucilaginibacter sp. AK015]MBB5394190.1 alanyl-tRNA synthetase [Mucilaginibacter sp. AK015]